MLKMWMFILIIDGKPAETFPSDSEAHCKQVMARMLYVQRAEGKKATGACYVKVATESDLPGPNVR
jgi:hypothetical protein